MRLKELCRRIKDIDKSGVDSVISDFYHELKNGYDRSILLGFYSDDLVGLDVYSLCNVLSIYESLIKDLGVVDKGILTRYKKVYCPKEFNNVFKNLESKFGYKKASELYTEWLECAIEPFKSRGILVSDFSYVVKE